MARGDERSSARLGAVQALYQMELTEKAVTDVMAEFEAHWLGRQIEDGDVQPTEAAFFRNILSGVLDEQTVIDRTIDAALAKTWPLARLEAVLRAILRAGCYELLRRLDVPVRVIIKEYVDIAGSFYADDEPGMVNAVLDRIGRDVRGDELSRGNG